MKIFLNPGHDRELDSGACNPNSGMREADVVYDVTQGITENIAKLLTAQGFEVECMQDNELSSVVDYANNSGADYFISIHCNAFNTVAKGTEVEIFATGGESEALAQSVQTQIVSCLGTIDRGLKERPGLYVLRSTDMPAILIEMAFIDNDEDAELLANKQDVFAKAIFQGILDFIVITQGDEVPYQPENEIAPNGKPYEKNDIDYLLGQGYTYGDAISTLALDPKYSNGDVIYAAKVYADSRVGSAGFGNNGCTAWVKDFLLHANSWVGQLMEDGSQGNLMWVPNLMDWAKENKLWKEPEEGGCLGDICLLETNGDWDDGPDHVVIACGDGDYWGNSSSRNLIVKSSIGGDFGEENVWGYVSTGIGNATVARGECQRSIEEVIGDAGSTSESGLGVVKRLAPNGKIYEANDIKYLLQEGYDYEGAIEELSKHEKYTKLVVDTLAPNGKPFEQNDIQYLLDNDYTLDAAITELKMADKYRA